MVTCFDWDLAKDAQNRRKHGVSFYAAQRAFLDPGRVIAADTRHSGVAARHYCFGRVAAAVLTARFAYRAGRIRIIGAGCWRKGKKIYETHTKIPR